MSQRCTPHEWIEIVKTAYDHMRALPDDVALAFLVAFVSGTERDVTPQDTASCPRADVCPRRGTGTGERPACPARPRLQRSWRYVAGSPPRVIG